MPYIVNILKSFGWVFGLFIALAGLFLGINNSLTTVWFTGLSLSFMLLLILTCIFLTKVILLSIKTTHMSGKVTLIKDAKTLSDSLYRRKKSVVMSAKEELIISGSRSKDQRYLNAILDRVQNSDLKVQRVLHHSAGGFSNELCDHLCKLIKFNNISPGTNREARVRIYNVGPDAEIPERFVCVSEKMALIIIPSSSNLKGFDSAVLIKDRSYCRNLIAQLRNYNSAAGVESVNDVATVNLLRKVVP